ncbi:MAG: 50S ribosomal protein L17 [Candidatus Riflebacteria bacterium]|nr:50S ribosomal protein L17 [Candidatus Riflebacteria bacterium]
MRHQKTGRKFGRESHQRAALFRSLCTSLVKYERITTTLQKAKDMRRFIEEAVSIAMTPDAEKNPRLAGYFHAVADREIVGRQNILNYCSNLKKDVREKLEKYMKDPDKNEKPEFVVEYLASKGDRAKGPRIMRVEGVMNKLIKTIAPRFKDAKGDVTGGYTRIYKLGFRRGDCAEMAIIEFSR